MQQALLVLSIAVVLLTSCDKDQDSKQNDEQQLGNSHVLGYQIDSSLIGTWHFRGSFTGEFIDVAPYGWIYDSVSYQNRYIDFLQNGLVIYYTLSTSGGKNGYGYLYFLQLGLRIASFATLSQLSADIG